MTYPDIHIINKDKEEKKQKKKEKSLLLLYLNFTKNWS